MTEVRDSVSKGSAEFIPAAGGGSVAGRARGAQKGRD